MLHCCIVRYFWLRHAVVGGAACNLLGSNMRTYDLDLVVDIASEGIRAIKQRIPAADPASFLPVGW